MLRSDLYDKVWSNPMIRVARELGISDVGLAKICRKHAVPVPPRGYWAKLKAGQPTSKTPLPAPELNPSIRLNTPSAEEIERRKESTKRQIEAAEKMAAKLKEMPQQEFPNELIDPLPLVRKTANYCDRLPSLIEKWEKRRATTWVGYGADSPPDARNGRYWLCSKGLLDITASLQNIAWVLRFHNTILQHLSKAGFRVNWLEHDKTRTARVEVRKGEEGLNIAFSEGYSRVKLDPKELEKRRAVRSWASEWEYSAADRATFSVAGTEQDACRSWSGSREKMQTRCLEIAQTIVELTASLPKFRELRQERQREAQRKADLIADKRRKAQARADQLAHAFKIAAAHEQKESLLRYLQTVEQQIPTFVEPYGERATVWLKVVREELVNRDPADVLLLESLSPPSWKVWPPDWWPADPSDENSKSDDVN